MKQTAFAVIICCCTMLFALYVSVEVTPQYLDVLTIGDIEPAFRATAKRRFEAILVLGSGIYASHRKKVVDLAIKNQFPSVFRSREYMEVGGLMSYGVNPFEFDPRAATYVDKILKGAKPADLPVEQPTKFEVAINLKPPITLV